MNGAGFTVSYQLTQEGNRRGKWKYIRMFDGKSPCRETDVDFSDRRPDFEMLFDLENDPGEWHNLIGTPAEPAALAELRRLCREHSEVLNGRGREFRQAFRVARRGK